MACSDAVMTMLVCAALIAGRACPMLTMRAFDRVLTAARDDNINVLIRMITTTHRRVFPLRAVRCFLSALFFTVKLKY